jgi:hypothetical protein
MGGRFESVETLLGHSNLGSIVKEVQKQTTVQEIS